MKKNYFHFLFGSIKTLYIFAPVKTQTTMQTLTANSFTKYAESNVKFRCRSVILAKVMTMFPLASTRELNIVTLGGEQMQMEKLMDSFYHLKGYSYEMKPNSVKIAASNAPKGIEIVQDNILNHIHQGNEDFYWFDFVSVLRYENLNLLLNWIQNNPISKKTIFAVSYSLHSRAIKGEGIRQLFETEIEHDEFIEDMGNYIGINLENDKIEVSNISITKYKNVDVSTKAVPMVQFIFTLNEK